MNEFHKLFQPLLKHKCAKVNFINQDSTQPDKMFGFICTNCNFEHRISLYEIKKQLLFENTMSFDDKTKLMVEIFKTASGRQKLIECLNEKINSTTS